MPDIFWVVSGQSAAGKSTVTLALIKLLNRRGIPTVGFKPFGAARLMEWYDVFAKELPEGSLWGVEMQRMVEASPLTRETPPEIILPVLGLIFDLLNEVVIVRAGAPNLDGVRFWTAKGSSKFLSRKDVAGILEEKKILERIAGDLAEFQIAQSSRRFHREVTSAFDHLVGLGPRAVVCEGAGGYFPVWDGQPRPAHVIFVGSGTLAIVGGSALSEYRLSRKGMAPRLQDFLPLSKSVAAQIHSIEYPLAVKEERQAVVEGALERLLTIAGIL